VQTSSVDDEGKAIKGKKLAEEDEKCMVRLIRIESIFSVFRLGWCMAGTSRSMPRA
jgi:hypothetical protein